ncbi:MAG: hypothetical protein QG639_954 [Patescibacteria group bacterium]|nr:hypothetical protein [Patescibacteria group bacterium]
MGLTIFYRILKWFNIVFFVIADGLLLYFMVIDPSLAEGSLLILFVVWPLLGFNTILYLIILLANWIRNKAFPRHYFIDFLLITLINPAWIVFFYA